MRSVVAMLAVLAVTAAAAAGDLHQVELGGAVIEYDADRWEVLVRSRSGDDPRSAHALFFCVASECFRERPLVWAAAEPADDPDTEPCPPSVRDDRGRPMLPGGMPETQTSPDKLALFRWVTHSNCRANTPAHREACGIAGGIRYSFGTGEHFGCGGIEGVPETLFAELLSGVKTASGPQNPR